MLQEVADAYTEQTDNVVVELSAVPWDDVAPRGAVATRLSLAQESEQRPDLWGPVPHSWAGSYAQQGQAMALHASEIESYGQYAQVALGACQVGEELYGLPVLMDSVGLLYNRALVPEPPQDFADLVRIAKELTDPDQDRWGLALPLLSPYHVYPFIDAYGGYLFGCSSGTCDLTDLGIANEGSVRGVQFVSDLYVKEGLFPEKLADRAVMHDYAVELFAEGRAALLIEGPWVVDRVRQGGIDYGVMAIPTLPEASGPARSLTVAQVLYVSSYSAHPAETIDLLNYIADEGIVPLQSVVGGVPVRQDVLRNDAFRQDREMREWYNLAVAGVALPNVPEMGFVWQPWRYALDKAIPGLESVEESLTEAAEAISEALRADQ